MKATGGKWIIDIWDYSKGTPPHKDLVIENEEFRIAVIDWDEGKENPYTIPEAEARANAQLFLKSRETLEALKALAENIDLSKLNVRKDFSLMNAHASALKAIRQAEE